MHEFSIPFFQIIVYISIFLQNLIAIYSELVIILEREAAEESSLTNFNVGTNKITLTQPNTSWKNQRDLLF